MIAGYKNACCHAAAKGIVLFCLTFLLERSVGAADQLPKLTNTDQDAFQLRRNLGLTLSCREDAGCSISDPCLVAFCYKDFCDDTGVCASFEKCQDTFCTEGATCQKDGSCSEATPTGICDDDNPCTKDYCFDYEFGDGGYCDNTPIPGCCTTDGECTDNVFCNGEETCVNNACTPGDAPDCDDDDICTEDFCDELNEDCRNFPIPGCCINDDDCNDGAYCNGEEECDANECIPGNAPVCFDYDSCTRDVCDETNDRCAFIPIVPCCGNGICETGESCSCESDCVAPFAQAKCGNGVCEVGNGEDCDNCAVDCARTRGAKQHCCVSRGSCKNGGECGLFGAPGTFNPEGAVLCLETAAEDLDICCGDGICRLPYEERCALDC